MVVMWFEVERRSTRSLTREWGMMYVRRAAHDFAIID